MSVVYTPGLYLRYILRARETPSQVRCSEPSCSEAAKRPVRPARGVRNPSPRPRRTRARGNAAMRHVRPSGNSTFLGKPAPRPAGPIEHACRGKNGRATRPAAARDGCVWCQAECFLTNRPRSRPARDGLAALADTYTRRTPSPDVRPPEKPRPLVVVVPHAPECVPANASPGRLVAQAPARGSPSRRSRPRPCFPSPPNLVSPRPVRRSARNEGECNRVRRPSQAVGAVQAPAGR